MVKATSWGGVGLALALLLAACSGTAVEAPAGSDEVQAAAVDEVAPTAEPTVVKPAVVTAGETPQATTVVMVEPALPDEVESEEIAAVQSDQGHEEATLVDGESEADKEDSPENEKVVTPVAEPVAAEDTEMSPQQPGPTETQRQLLANLTVKGTPPELDNEVWLNADPLKLADLRGKVAIVEFWTFG